MQIIYVTLLNSQFSLLCQTIRLSLANIRDICRNVKRPSRARYWNQDASVSTRFSDQFCQTRSHRCYTPYQQRAAFRKCQVNRWKSQTSPLFCGTRCVKPALTRGSIPRTIRTSISFPRLMWTENGSDYRSKCHILEVSRLFIAFNLT